jgi:hypothetical protein
MSGFIMNPFTRPPARPPARLSNNWTQKYKGPNGCYFWARDQGQKFSATNPNQNLKIGKEQST